MTEQPDVDAGLDALYAGPLDEFVSGRDALAARVAEGGDRVGSARLKRLRRPTVAAWAVNQVARRHADEVAALAQLGDELRAATVAHDRGRITALDKLRRERTEALLRPLRAAGEIAGRPVSAAVFDQLAESLRAVVMDPDAAAVVQAGRLTQALQHVGFGILDEAGEAADVVALRAAVPEQKTSDAELAKLRERREDVDRRARAAREAAERHEAELARLEEELERLAAESDAVRTALRDARRTERAARAELAAVEGELGAAGAD